LRHGGDVLVATRGKLPHAAPALAILRQRRRPASLAA
jgi:hypothetical protein